MIKNNITTKQLTEERVREIVREEIAKRENKLNRERRKYMPTLPIRKED